MVDGNVLYEPYIVEHSFGNCDLQLPYQVPEGKYFLVGDHRATSVDSRHTTVGCISADDIVGKIVYRIWPMDTIGAVK